MTPWWAGIKASGLAQPSLCTQSPLERFRPFVRIRRRRRTARLLCSYPGLAHIEPNVKTKSFRVVPHFEFAGVSSLESDEACGFSHLFVRCVAKEEAIAVNRIVCNVSRSLSLRKRSLSGIATCHAQIRANTIIKLTKTQKIQSPARWICVRTASSRSKLPNDIRAASFCAFLLRGGSASGTTFLGAISMLLATAYGSSLQSNPSK